MQEIFDTRECATTIKSTIDLNSLPFLAQKISHFGRIFARSKQTEVLIICFIICVTNTMSLLTRNIFCTYISHLYKNTKSFVSRSCARRERNSMTRFDSRRYPFHLGRIPDQISFQLQISVP